MLIYYFVVRLRGETPKFFSNFFFNIYVCPLKRAHIILSKSLRLAKILQGRKTRFLLKFEFFVWLGRNFWILEFFFKDF